MHLSGCRVPLPGEVPLASGEEGRKEIFGGDCSAGTTQGREKEATKLPGEAPPGILPGTWRVR